MLINSTVIYAYTIIQKILMSRMLACWHSPVIMRRYKVKNPPLLFGVNLRVLTHFNPIGLYNVTQ